MKRIENNCCECAVPGYPCLGSYCPNRHVPHYYCDECEAEEQLYHFDGKELCLECIEAKLKKVEGSGE